MKRILLSIPVAVFIFILIWHAVSKQQASVKVSTPTVTDNLFVIDSLTRQLKTTTDSFHALKPAVEQAIAKLKFYDSLYKDGEKRDDTLWITRLKRDLYEARLEIRRLCEPYYYRVTFKQ